MNVCVLCYQYRSYDWIYEATFAAASGAQSYLSPFVIEWEVEDEYGITSKWLPSDAPYRWRIMYEEVLG